MARTALFGGSFNPIHYGHLLLADEVRERLGLARVVFMPAGIPPHKPAAGMAPGEHRLAMVRLAIAGNPAFEASDLELRRTGPSYTADTVEALGVAPADLYLVIGSETFLDLLSWHEPRRIAARCRLVVIPRARSAFDPESAAAQKVLREIGADGIARADDGAPDAGVIVLHATSLPLSASDIRARVARGASITYRVPPPVADYIARHRLYGGRA
ncbi:MAG: nicotinate (nicotinamide) nucleotide adenylyltransferase [Candidatus Rokubacteria bacterium]|nr:nicotinate (nicotinamide) nucleotide adenylyltransferase [Candidatus Rokubacteria bacterium]